MDSKSALGLRAQQPRLRRGWKDFWTPSYILDYVVIIIAAAICMPLWKFAQTNKMYLRYDDPDYNIPLRKSTIPQNVVLPLIFIPVPLCLLALQLWFRSLHDLHHALLGFVQTITLCTIIHVFLWMFLGEPRPNFMSKCKPVPGAIGGKCTNEGDPDVIDGRHDFPSGLSIINLMTFSRVVLS